MSVKVGDFLAASVNHFHHPYSTTNRFGPVNYDCSGHVWASLADCGVRWGPTVSSTMYAACIPIPLSQAVHTPGALIFMPDNPLRGSGSSGHVAIVLNPFGFTSEARGHAWGVGSWPIAGRGFSNRAGLIPVVNYSGGGGVIPPVVVSNPVIAAVAELTAVAVAHGNQPLGAAGTGLTLDGKGSHGDQVVAWQNALNLTVNAALTADGDFGPRTAKATGAFAKTYNYLAGAAVLNVFGIVDDGRGLPPFGPVRSAMVQALDNVKRTHGG